MNATEHLTSFQINGYYAGAFAENESHEIGRHLLQCLDCRKLLPAPTPEMLWRAISTERDADEAPARDKTRYSLFSLGRFNSGLFNHNRMIAWGSGALIILMGCSVLIWLSGARYSGGEREVAQSFGPERLENSSVENESVLEIDQPPDSPEAQITKPGKARVVSSAPKYSEPDPNKRMRTENKANVALTRGAAPNCFEETGFQTEVGAIGDTVILKWKAIPDAANYHLYVSDDDEILVDEYETEKETSYLLRKPLDPGKNYKWKIIITLENGRTIVGGSQKFSMTDLRQTQMKPEKTGKLQVRCLAHN